MSEETMNKKMDRMDCGQFEEIVHELDRLGTRGMALREVALAHSEMCSHCAALLTENESLDFALIKLAEDGTRDNAPPRIEASLLQQFRRTKAHSAQRRVRWQLAVLGTAAALFLALGFSLRHHSVPSLGSGAGTQASATMPGPDGASSGVKHDAQSRSPVPAKTELAADRATAVGHDVTEEAQEFRALPYADDPSAVDDGAVVRVVLSRSAFASFGLPVSELGSAEQVSADLLLSADGTPEAIRLVSQNMN